MTTELSPELQRVEKILGDLTIRAMALTEIAKMTGPPEAAELAAHIHDEIVQARLKIMGRDPISDAAPMPDFIARAKS